MESGFFNSWKNSGLPSSGSTVSGPTSSNGNLGFKGGTAGKASTLGQDPYVIDALNMGPKERLALSKLLKNAGYLKTASSKYNKKLGDAYREAANNFQAESVRTARPTLTLTQFLTENVQAGTGDGAPNIPSRSIYQYTDADRQKMIDDVSVTLRGQGITEADKAADWYKGLRKSIDKMISTGTLQSSKKVRNPKTGQLETQIISTPGFSQEQAAATAEKVIRKATPEDVARKERVDFTSWMLGTLGGSNG
jgi:hypothetical protein